MDLKVSTIAAIIAILTSALATYNAFLLRGGKLAWSEVFIALGMMAFTFSLVLNFFLPPLMFSEARVSDLLFILGFIFLFVASLKLRFALR